jgi:hypothetical protein
MEAKNSSFNTGGGGYSGVVGASSSSTSSASGKSLLLLLRHVVVVRLCHADAILAVAQKGVLSWGCSGTNCISNSSDGSIDSIEKENVKDMKDEEAAEVEMFVSPEIDCLAVIILQQQGQHLHTNGKQRPHLLLHELIRKLHLIKSQVHPISMHLSLLCLLTAISCLSTASMSVLSVACASRVAVAALLKRHLFAPQALQFFHHNAHRHLQHQHTPHSIDRQNQLDIAHDKVKIISL